MSANFGESKDNKIYQSATILHFTGMSKPWQYINKHPYKKEYYKYIKKTPWKGYKPEDKTIGNFLRKYKLMPKWYDVIGKQ
jgi:lipopolysaccharide biosynthesis glycosyltransferase